MLCIRLSYSPGKREKGPHVRHHETRTWRDNCPEKGKGPVGAGPSSKNHINCNCSHHIIEGGERKRALPGFLPEPEPEPLAPLLPIGPAAPIDWTLPKRRVA